MSRNIVLARSSFSTRARNSSLLCLGEAVAIRPACPDFAEPGLPAVAGRPTGLLIAFPVGDRRLVDGGIQNSQTQSPDEIDEAAFLINCYIWDAKKRPQFPVPAALSSRRAHKQIEMHRAQEDFEDHINDLADRICASQCRDVELFHPSVRADVTVR
ncbi:hypothetical protein [Lichenicola sp.]|uniref:hypothetical protein n=1 Tax=Lichenicola sp. TaxID=2804529 RepID=UPI003AFFE82A